MRERHTHSSEDSAELPDIDSARFIVLGDLPDIEQGAPPARAPSSWPACVLSALVFAVCFTMLYSATELGQATNLIGYEASFSHVDNSETVAYETVSENFVLQQLVRAFLGAPWQLSERESYPAGRSHTWRQTPPEGWTFPLHELEEGVEPGGEHKEEEEEGVTLAKSATAILSKSLTRPQPQGWDATGGSTDGGNIDDTWNGDAFDERERYDGGGSDMANRLDGESASEAEALAALQDSEAPAAEAAVGMTADGSVDDALNMMANPHARGIVAAAGRSVLLAYLGGAPASLRHVGFCSRGSDWLCMAPEGSPLRRSSRLELLPLLLPLRNGSSEEGRDADSTSANASATSGVSTAARATDTAGADSLATVFGGWFALRAVHQGGLGGLVQLAPPDDEEGWVMRARGASRQTELAHDGAFTTALEVSASELWRQDGDGLRHLATGALVNFRGGDDGGDDTSLRGHGDSKPRRAAVQRTPRTRFEVRVMLPSSMQSNGGTNVASDQEFDQD